MKTHNVIVQRGKLEDLVAPTHDLEARGYVVVQRGETLDDSSVTSTKKIGSTRFIKGEGRVKKIYWVKLQRTPEAFEEWKKTLNKEMVGNEN